MFALLNYISYRTSRTSRNNGGDVGVANSSTNRPNHQINYLRIYYFLQYNCGELGSDTLSSMVNSLWFNNTLHFGVRAGGTEHRQLRWGDLQLCYDHDLKQKYIEFNERQTKTRTGEDVSNTRNEKPRMYAVPGDSRCPVAVYKKYADKRPEKMCSDDSPFYLATVTNKYNPGENERWFLSQPIGVNKLNTLLKTMATKAELPGLPYLRITNTSVRKHLCQKLLDNNVPDTQAIHITGHKNPQSLNDYRKLSNRQKQHVSTLLSTSANENEKTGHKKPQALDGYRKLSNEQKQQVSSLLLTSANGKQEVEDVSDIHVPSNGSELKSVVWLSPFFILFYL